MKIRLEATDLNEFQVRNWPWLGTTFCTKKSIFFSVLSSKACQIFKTENKLSGFHYSKQFMHFYSRPKGISAIIIETKVRNTLKWMLCFFKSNLSVFIKMVIGKIIFLPLELTE